MPGWIWVILVVFLLVVLVVGGLYAFRKGKAALGQLGELGKRAGKDMDAMGESPEPAAPRDPAVTQPLEATAARYEQAHAARLDFKQVKRNRHVSTWRRWERFNTDADPSTVKSPESTDTANERVAR